MVRDYGTLKTEDERVLKVVHPEGAALMFGFLTPAPLALCCSLLLVLTGCNGASPSGETGGANGTGGTTDSQQEESISVDEGLLTVEVRLPMDLFMFGAEEGESTPTEAEIQANLDREGRGIEATVNDDGTVTYRMSRGEYERFKGDLKAGVDESIQQALNEEAEIYKSITYDADVKNFRVTVDRQAFENSLSFLQLGLIISGVFYQAFTGVPENERFVLIEYVDETTGEVFDDYDSKTWQGS